MSNMTKSKAKRESGLMTCTATCDDDSLTIFRVFKLMEQNFANDFMPLRSRN